jgi:tetratricopeptide (TPR) repeat protein
MNHLANVEPLEPPEMHYLSAALGWLGLGNADEAEAELAHIPAARQSHPDVLEARWLICAEEQRWDQGLQIARTLLEAAPDRATGWLHQAYALRRVPGGSIRKAWEALLPAFDKFPHEEIISYNLSCYACQLQQLEAARVWFKRALVIGGRERMKKMALADADLKCLWEEIKQF